jgi:hypothetical protein
MKSYYHLIDELTINKWYFYWDVHTDTKCKKTFTETLEYSSFISDYFRKSGKIEIFK